MHLKEEWQPLNVVLPVIAKTVNMSNQLNDDKEEKLLQSDLTSLCLVDIKGIVAPYTGNHVSTVVTRHTSLEKQLNESLIGHKGHLAMEDVSQEQHFEEQMKKSMRVL